MILQSPKAFKAVAMFLIFSLTQLCVRANLVVSDNDTRVTPSTVQQVLPVGMLMIRGSSPVMLNGNESSAGTTVLSGAQLFTTKNAGASVQLGALGSLDVAADTNLTLHFNNGNVNVALTNGCALLKTNRGTNGIVTTPNGEPVHTDLLKNSFVNVCVAGTVTSVVNQSANEDVDKATEDFIRHEKIAFADVQQGKGRFDDDTAKNNDNQNRDRDDNDNDREGGLGRHGVIAIVAAAAASAIVLGIVAANRGRGRNPSPGTPRGSA